MPAELSVKILTFDSFTELGDHMQGLRQKYRERLKEYEDKLGLILRDLDPSKVGDPKERQVQREWIIQMKGSIRSSQAGAPRPVQPVKKDNGKGGMFGFGKKDSSDNKQAKGEDWIQLGPSLIFLGKSNRGLAEMYFDSINALRANLDKVNSIISVCEKLKAKTMGIGNGTLMVYFVQDIPQRILLKMKDGKSQEKYKLIYNLTIPASRNIVKSAVI